MVHKASHRGVHSGNTLRAFNSRYSRRYHHQSCIVSRVRPELLQKLAGRRKADDKKLESCNVAVDVPLSLNKQSRWCLPSALVHQIQSNDIADSSLTVSLLERHKLKQRASCVSFHSNKGEVKCIQPRNGRYFGFSYPTRNGKSRRALRREQRALVKNKEGRIEVVFTEQGQARSLGESEVRYEVYYPSPAQSSISHNPKYIKQGVDLAYGEDERALHGKPKKQHRARQRQRLSLKDLDDCDLPPFHARRDQPSTVIPGQGECAPTEGIREGPSTTECLMATLIEKAQKLQNFKGSVKPRRKKKTVKNSSPHEHDKSHIVYLHDCETSTSPDETSTQSPSLTYPALPGSSESTRIMLPKDDVTMPSLRECFGRNYFEAACKPRKFVLDVTEYVEDALKKQEVPAAVTEKFSLSYLVCIHDGVYDDDYDVYKVLLNSRLQQRLMSIPIIFEENQDLHRGTMMDLVSRTMDFVESFVTDLKNKDSFPVSNGNIRTLASGRQLNSHLASVEAYVPSVQRMFQKGSDISEVAMPTLSDQLEEDPVFCDVCYDDISPLTYGSAAHTCLLKCKHHVCDSCWSQHTHVRLHEGFVRLTCPGHDCQEDVGLGVLLSLVPLDTVEKLLQRQEEVRVGGSQTKKWCPNPYCGRIISLQSPDDSGELQLQQDVVCACGVHVCFQCLTPAHWPASCKQAEDYRAGLATAVFPDRLAEVHDDLEVEQQAAQQAERKQAMVVEGKRCPRCRTFVNKNGGCPQMVCYCGEMFCWFCGKPGFSHPSRFGCVSINEEKNITTTLVVHHLEAEQNSESSKEGKPTGNRRQRMSLTERAVEHRRQLQNKQRNVRAVAALAKTVALAAARNKVLSEHIIKACTQTFPFCSLKPSAECPVVESVSCVNDSVLKVVTAFLKNAAQSRQELHEVVEYSLVLLKDLPDSLLRRRALRISEDLGAFCSFSQSVFDSWSSSSSGQSQGYQDAVKAVMRLAEIQRWIQSSLDAHVVTVRKLRGRKSPRH